MYAIRSYYATGPVNSVMLFSPCPPDQLAGQKIALTSESATSINLLRVLLLEFFGHTSINDFVPEHAVEQEIAAGNP